MAQIDPRQLLQAAMASGGSGGVPSDSIPIPGAASAAGGTAAGPQGGMQDALPEELAGAQPVGAENSGVLAGTTGALNNQELGQMVGAGEGNNTMQLVQALQDPRTPPDQKAMIQAQLQLAALKSIAGGPSGAIGSPGPGR